MSIYVARVFSNGRSQAVRLPKIFRFDTDEVYIRQVGDEIVLSAKKPNWVDFFSQTSAFAEDFLAQRDNAPPQQRESF